MAKSLPLPVSRKLKKKRRLQVDVDEKLGLSFKEACRQEGVTQTETLEWCIQTWFDRIGYKRV